GLVFRPGRTAVDLAKLTEDARFGRLVVFRRGVPLDAQLVFQHARETVRHHVVADDLNRDFLCADDALRAAVELADAVGDVREHLTEAAARKLPFGASRTDARKLRNQNENENQNRNPEPRTPNPEPLHACPPVWAPRIAKIDFGFKLESTSTARATKAEAFATAKLTPFRFRSRGTPGISRGYGDDSTTVRPPIVASAYASRSHAQSARTGI